LPIITELAYCAITLLLEQQPIQFSNFSQAAENNHAPILNELKKHLRQPLTLLEVGSGSGQHAIRFAIELPHIIWQPCDQGEYFDGLKENLSRLAPTNVLPPHYLDLNDPYWPIPFDALYSANVIHIMPERLLPQMFTSPADLLIFYGPYKYNGEFTSESNARFDVWLKDRNCESGVRDIESLLEQASEAGYKLISDTVMPANNQFLVLGRISRKSSQAH
jgi:hypothetical protein